MKRQSFALTIICLFLLLLLFNLPPKQIQSEEQLKNFLSNQKLLIQGQVIKETYTDKDKVLLLNNNFTLFCPNPCSLLLNKNISAITKLELYNNNRYLKILKIKILD